MKKPLLILILCFISITCFSQVRPIKAINNNTVKTNEVNANLLQPTQADSLKMQIKDLQQQLDKLKTELMATYKLLDYSLGQLKKNFDNHYHSVNTLRVTGLVQNNLGSSNSSYKVALVSYGNDHSTETGKPLQKEE